MSIGCRQSNANVILIVIVVKFLLACRYSINVCHGLAVHPYRLSSSSVSIRLNKASVLKLSDSGKVAEVKNESNEDKERSSISPNWTKATLSLAIPALIGMIADPFLSLVDTFFTGKLGTKPLAALGPCTSIFHLFFNAFRATTFATTSLVAAALASEKEGEESAASAEMVTSTSLQFSVVTGLCLTLILLQFSEPILSLMGVTAGSELLPYALSYLRWRALAAPFVLFCSVSEGAFRGYGNTKIPTVASLVAGGFNCILDPILMFTFQLGIQGAAIATSTSQAIAVATYCFFLKAKKMLLNQNTTKPKQQTLQVRKKVIKSIIQANLAMLCKQGSLLLAWAYATSRATRIGASHVAAHQVALSCWLFFILILDGASVAAQVLASKHINSPSRTMSLTKYILKFSIAQGLIGSGFILLLRDVIPTLFTTNLAIQTHLYQLIPIISFQQTLVSFTLSMEGLVLGQSQFKFLAFGTTISTIISMFVLKYHVHSVFDIWMYGINSLFVCRLLFASSKVLANYLHCRSKLLKNDHGYDLA